MFYSNPAVREKGCRATFSGHRKEYGDTLMEKKEYISEEERKKCRRVAEVFAELDEEKL